MLYHHRLTPGAGDRKNPSMMRALAWTVVWLAGGCARPALDPTACEEEGACVAAAPECARDADCGPTALGPICDARSQKCRPCAAHSECASGLCRTSEAISAPV